MSKKNNKISINALEKYCGQFNTEPQDIEIHYGEDEVFTFTVKPLLTMDESVRFIEEVVRECIMPDDMLIQRSIDERIAFEEQKMIAEQQSNVRKITEDVSEFVSKMSSLFDGIDPEQMDGFMTSVSKMAQNTEISAQSLASAFLESRNSKED